MHPVGCRMNQSQGQRQVMHTAAIAMPLQVRRIQKIFIMNKHGKHILHYTNTSITIDSAGFLSTLCAGRLFVKIYLSTYLKSNSNSVYNNLIKNY